MNDELRFVHNFRRYICRKSMNSENFEILAESNSSLGKYDFIMDIPKIRSCSQTVDFFCALNF